MMVLHKLVNVGPDLMYGKYELSMDAVPQILPLRLIVCAAIARRTDTSLTLLWPLAYRKAYR